MPDGRRPSDGRARNAAVPSLEFDHWLALAFVTGRYSPPGCTLGPLGFLSLYTSRQERAFAFIVSSARGNRLAFSQAGSRNATVEFALIEGAITWATPFDQWRLYPLAKADENRIRKLGAWTDYAADRAALAGVLYLSRVKLYSRVERLFRSLKQDPAVAMRPMFSTRLRSPGAIQRAVDERREIFRLAGVQDESFGLKS